MLFRKRKRPILDIDLSVIDSILQLSPDDTYNTHATLIGGDLDKCVHQLKEGVIKDEIKSRSRALHGLYQTAASSGLSTIIDAVTSLQTKNNAGKSSPVTIQDVEDLEILVQHTIDYIRKQDHV